MTKNKSIIKLFLLINFLFFNISIAFSSEQFRLDNWEVYTSQYDVLDIDIDKNGLIWAATNGGIFSYDIEKDIYTNYTDLFNLLTINFTAVECNHNNDEVIFGSVDGTIEILTKDRKWIHITDVRVAGFSNPKIYDIVIKDDKAFIAGGWGLAVFDLKERVFIETIKKFGDFATNTKSSKIDFIGNFIYVSSDLGVAKADLNSILADNNSWETFVVGDGVPSIKINSLAKFKDTIFVSTGNYLCYIDENSKTIKFHTNATYNINSIFAGQNSKLYVSTQYNLITVNPTEQLIWSNDFIQKTVNFIDKNGKELILSSIQNNSIGILKNNQFEFIAPNTPTSNNIGDIKIDTEGNLFFVNPRSSKSFGITSFINGKWSSKRLTNHHSFKMNLTNNNQILSSSWGNGLYIAKTTDTGYVYDYYSNKNSPLKGIATNPDYVVVGESVEDKNGTVWVVNFGETSLGPVLVGMDKSGNFYEFNNLFNSTDRYFMTLAIDHNGTKWLGAYSNGRGLVAINDNKTLNDKSDDKFKFFSPSSYPNLQSNWVKSLQVDKLGWLWIGTDAGLSVCRNTSSFLTNNNVDFNIYKKLNNQTINAILIDPLNNKWIATNQGIWVLNYDGSEVIATINTQNSPLLSDEINSLAMNPNTGEVYIGTQFGLFKASSLSVKPYEDFDLKAYPQPFNMNKDNELVIEGLAADSDLKILALDGSFVASIISQGGKAVWNAKDSNGNKVKSGVYLISAYSTTNKSNSVLKIAIINK